MDYKAIVLGKAIGDIILSEGGWVYLPQGDAGFLSAVVLRIIADELDRLNAELFAEKGM